MARKPYNSATLSNKSDTRWVDERLEHESQRRKYKSYIFWGAVAICVLMYSIFLGYLGLLFLNTIAMQMFVAHKHIAALLVTLLLVPSAMLWGLVRAVFNVETQPNYTDAIKEGIKIHPFG